MMSRVMIAKIAVTENGKIAHAHGLIAIVDH